MVSLVFLKFSKTKNNGEILIVYDNNNSNSKTLLYNLKILLLCISLLVPTLFFFSLITHNLNLLISQHTC
jgi:hypothetical protein